MVAFVEGELVQRAATAVVLNCGGVGVRVIVPGRALQQLPAVGQRVRLWTVLELFQEPGGHGEFRLYGFLTEAEARVFELLRGVAGVGSKTALTILSATSVAELREYILQGDSRALQRLPGVGKKTAERLVVELRERIVQVEAEDVSGIPAAVRQEAVAALMALGYSRSEAERGIRDALLHALPDSLTAEALIKLALRCLQS